MLIINCHLHFPVNNENLTSLFCFSALESADSNFSPSGSSDRDLLSDVPNLKKTLYLLQHDLVRVQRMAAYHR